MTRSTFMAFSEKAVRTVGDFGIAHGIPGIEDHENLVGLPNVHALYGEDGSIVPASRHVHFDASMYPAAKLDSAITKYAARYQDRIAIPPDLHVEERPVTIIADNIGHWGHWLTDGLARAWAIVSGHVDPSECLPLFTIVHRPTPHWLLTMLATLGIPADRIIYQTRPTLYRRVRIVMPSINYTIRIYRNHPAAHRFIADRIDSMRKFDDPVFISRAGVANGIHNFAGEDEIESALVAKGFQSIRPETLSVSDQVALFRTCPLIVGSIGSAFHSILFEAEYGNHQRVMISAENLGARFTMIDAVCTGHQSTYINAVSRFEKRRDISTIDVNAALSALKSIGI